LDDLNKQIMDLKVKIAGEQSKLNAYSPPVVVTPAVVAMPVRPDSTQHR